MSDYEDFSEIFMGRPPEQNLINLRTESLVPLWTAHGYCKLILKFITDDTLDISSEELEEYLEKIASSIERVQNLMDAATFKYPSVSLIVAMDRNRLIGAENGLPWRLPDDMKWFVEKTLGKPVIMGRKTYDSIPSKFKPLKDRHNIIVTRNRDYEAAGCTVVHSVDEALAAAGEVPEIIIGGGTQIYAQTLPLAHRLYLTLIDGVFEGDAYFPEFDLADWEIIFQEDHEADGRHTAAFTWFILQK